MNAYFIYTLVNPINREVFYVGCTKNLKERESYHTCNLTWRAKKLREYYRKNKITPIFNVIAKVSCLRKASELEEMYIKMYRERGLDLANAPTKRPYHKGNLKVA